MKKCIICLILTLSLLLSACGALPSLPEAVEELLPEAHGSGEAVVSEPEADVTPKPIPVPADEPVQEPAVESSPEPTAEATPEPTPEPTPTVPAEPVVDAWSREGEYSDEVGNNYHYIYRIPAINSDSKDAQRLNEEAKAFVLDLIQSDLDNIEGNKGYSLWCSRAVYQYWQHGDLVSVLISISNDWGQDYYMTMNYNFAWQQALSREDMLALGNMDEELFLQRAAEAAGAAFGDPSQFPSDMMQFAEDQYSKTVMPENLQLAKLFLNGDGKLCMAVPIYSMAGADYYWRIVEL